MTTENFWGNNHLGQKIVEVLADVTYTSNPDHHFGRPFVTAYQLAIIFKERFPEKFSRFGHPIGGKDSGVQFSFTSYLAGQMSQKIKSGEISGIEGGFLSNQGLRRIDFDDDGDTVTSSLTGSGYDLSMFRLRLPTTPSPKQ